MIFDRQTLIFRQRYEHIHAHTSVSEGMCGCGLAIERYWPDYKANT